MNKFTRTAISATFFLLAGSSVIAADLTKAEYDSAKTEATAKYKADRTACKTLSGNAKDICVEEAKGQEQVTKATLKDQFSPSVEHRYALRMAKADAAYAVAKEKCDAMAGDGALFAREDAVEAAWVAVDKVLKRHSRVVPYKRGSWGPEEANALLKPHGVWHNPTLSRSRSSK